METKNTCTHNGKSDISSCLCQGYPISIQRTCLHHQRIKTLEDFAVFLKYFHNPWSKRKTRCLSCQFSELSQSLFLNPIYENCSNF